MQKPVRTFRVLDDFTRAFCDEALPDFRGGATKSSVDDINTPLDVTARSLSAIGPLAERPRSELAGALLRCTL